RIKDADDDEFMRVQSRDGNTYTVERDLANTYSSNQNPAWKKGTAVVMLGNSNGTDTFSGGWLEMLGSGLNSPYYSVIKRTGINYNAFQQIARFGNLKGYLDYSSDEYGIAIGDSSRYFTYDPSQGIRLRSTKGDYVIEIMTNPLKIKLNDGTYDRIVIGETASNVYGIEIRSPSGVTMFDIDNNDQRISTADGKTYWDLKNGRFIVNDGITDRVLIGRLD
ncbi:MAG TPA: hypothetical protein PKN66_10335, partial [Thermodesulfovibrio thiophilus]|nr:hypothetical protein [Thermodesulfovibrio thiophilus]